MKKTLNKLYWIFWFSTTLLTGILAGFMISHSIMLGRFFSWSVESGRLDLLRQTFTIFREVSQPDPNTIYYIPIYLAFVSGVIWTVLAFVMKRERTIALIAGLSTLWVGMLFMISDIDEAEEAVLSGTADAQMAQFFASINVPIHSLFAVIYTASLFLLLWVAFKGYWRATRSIEPVEGLHDYQ
jgi:hypothetical protein